MEHEEVTRDSPPEAIRRVIAEKQARREARKEKVQLLRLQVQMIYQRVKTSMHIRPDIKEELLSRIQDIDIIYEEEMEGLIH